MFVIGFDQPHKAEEACLKLQELQGKYVLDIQDTVIALKDEKGKVKLQQRGSLLTAESQVFPGFCGSLTSLIFLNATTGAAGGALAAVGITEHFMKELAATLIPGGSALFVVTGRPSPDRENVLTASAVASNIGLLPISESLARQAMSGSAAANIISIRQ